MRTRNVQYRVIETEFGYIVQDDQMGRWRRCLTKGGPHKTLDEATRAVAWLEDVDRVFFASISQDAKVVYQTGGIPENKGVFREEYAPAYLFIAVVIGAILSHWIFA